ncbi:MAG: aspartate kinase [Spirochaetaceae bacterium]|nr:MAG: aspartate kinase [Spirochaetaceae bacterium]
MVRHGDLRMIVMKFGGSSIADAEKVRRAVGLVAEARERAPVVVVSAHGKTTDQLLESARRASLGTIDTSVITGYHQKLLSDLDLEPTLCDDLFDRLQGFIRGVSLIRELTPRTIDQILAFGEQCSTRIVAACMRSQGLPGVAVNSFEIGLETDSRHGAATPLPGIDASLASHLRKIEGIAVVTGFLGKDASGSITTLGRSGSDYTASIVGAALGVEEIQIWTDVSGVMTCDPSVDPRARSLARLSFEEASELAYYGAEVLHPATLVPAIRKGIPVRVLNTMHPADSGSIILPESALTESAAKSIVYKEDVCLITIASARLMSAVEILSRAFGILSDSGIGVHMATTSEATVSLVTDRDYDEQVVSQAMNRLAGLGTAQIYREQAIVCVIGEELKGKVRILEEIFAALGSNGIKARMVSQSATEINIAVLIRNAEIATAVTSLHELILAVPQSLRGERR